MSSVRFVELVLLLPPPQAMSATDSEVSHADQTPNRLPGFLNALPPQEISSDLVGTLWTSGAWRSKRLIAESSVRASPTDLSASPSAARGRCRIVIPLWASNRWSRAGFKASSTRSCVRTPDLGGNREVTVSPAHSPGP